MAGSGARVIGALAVATLWAASLAAGGPAFATTTGVLLGFAYIELRRDVAGTPAPSSMVIGLAGVAAFVVVAGRGGRPEQLPWIVAGLVVALLTARVLAAELGRAPVSGATAEVGSTLLASCATGLLGAHLLLVGTTSRFGFRGLVLFVAAAVARGVAAQVASVLRRPESPDAVVLGGGLLAAAIAGGVCGAILSPPFTAASGLVLGGTVGTLAAIGDAGLGLIARHEGRGILRLVGGPMVSAPAFYWVFRTLVL